MRFANSVRVDVKMLGVLGEVAMFCEVSSEFLYSN
jgi:hypothetical protein